ncbi:hypothetical protein VTK56DRAFT_5884 [Thermocarpiscus australiensis]
MQTCFVLLRGGTECIVLASQSDKSQTGTCDCLHQSALKKPVVKAASRRGECSIPLVILTTSRSQLSQTSYLQDDRDPRRANLPSLYGWR